MLKMTNNKKDFSEYSEVNNSTPIYEIIGKYMLYWPWFLASISIAMLLSMFYLRYSSNVYKTVASIKISVENNQNMSLDISKIFSKSSINLFNEKAVLKSYRLSEKLVKDLNLNISYIYKDKIKESNTYNPPFIVSYRNSNDSIFKKIQYVISITKDGYSVLDEKSGKTYKTNGFWMFKSIANFPITIQPAANNNIMKSIGKSFIVSLCPIKEAALQLSNSITIIQQEKESDILNLSISGTDANHSEMILNALIKAYEEDGIKDKQEVFKKTIAFVDNRFIKIKKELDSIEESKKIYKTNNDLSFLPSDAEASLGNKFATKKNVSDLNLQISLAKMLREDLEKQTNYNLLPENIGITNTTINSLVNDYNIAVLGFQKMHTTAGNNNPALQIVNNTLSSLKNNINNSTSGYILQLQTTIDKGEEEEKNAHSDFSTIPEKEKILRSIERQQNLKESLYLLLLQKREEASVNNAITNSNTKIIDYAITESGPISPKRQTTYLTAILIGLFIPFGIIFLIFSLDDKIHKVSDVEKLSKGIPILSEIPTVLDTKDGLLQKTEAFRTLVNNTNFITPFEETDGKLIFVTSAKKGEGKTFVAYNLSVAYANLDKKTILMGTDFRNPQLHKHLHKNRNEIKGLSNYLHKSESDWRDLLYKQKENDSEFDILLAGDIPPNPTLLLSSQRLIDLIAELKKEYDVIIFDTAPCLLVSDSLIISKYADTTLFVVRSEITEKKLVEYAVKLNMDDKINNVAFVLNGINFKNIYGYNYSYSYGYGYGYGYNYGYGYGYGLDEDTKKWYHRLPIVRFIMKNYQKFTKK